MEARMQFTFSISILCTPSIDFSRFYKWGRRRRKRDLSKCSLQCYGLYSFMNSCAPFEHCEASDFSGSFLGHRRGRNLLVHAAHSGDFLDGWGPNYSISTVRGRSDLYILNAANHIIRGEASCLTMLHEILSDMMLSGGSDSVIIPVGLGGFVACKALSQRNTEPTKVLHPGNHSKMNLAKSMTGRLLGAHGAVEAVATVQGFRTGWVHPNLNLENPDDGVVCCSSPTFLRQHFHMQRVSSPLDSHVYF
ncbi:3-oxoacyl-[acyl-carrier-protein] synthase I, chloroplastic-like isoform X2 [Primulina tabacum]|uniref:3-oxoacyl-[acyl-carrier-protein] synthase I, chloroplastic-like isoform X2 n=1 Tax=Primulina tabacum TaxID=48773 RepID=UPI003F59F841